MLHRLRIKDFAIVESLELECGGGLSVFTGETGAGKSVLVEALRFLLGGRASVEMIRTGADAAIVEGLFDWPTTQPGDEALLGGEPPEQVWVRRELPLKGAGRCFIGDRQITRAALSRLAERLGDLCGQHQQQVLLDPQRHTAFLDDIAGHGDLVEQVNKAWLRLSENLEAQAQLAAALEQRRAHRELVEFQIAEIRQASVAPHEDETLKAEAVVLKNARRLAESSDQVLGELVEADNAIAARVAALLRSARKMSELDSRWSTVSERLALWQEEIEDLSRHLADYRRQLELDPLRLDRIEARLADLYHLKTKYGGSCTAILERLEQLEGEHEADGREEERADELRHEQADLEKALAQSAARLTHRRQESITLLEDRINALLGKLGMPSARLKIERCPFTDGGLTTAAGSAAGHIHKSGAEAVRFTFEANPNEGFKPLDKIVSGGELSRLLLAFKSIVIEHKLPERRRSKANGTANGHGDTPLYVFDEIDAGIGGAVAYAVAKQVKSLAQHTQVFLISHLQQMAAAADTHFLTEKQTVDGRARVTIRRLDDQARVREVARMLAGDEITDRTLQLAAEMTDSSPE